MNHSIECKLAKTKTATRAAMFVGALLLAVASLLFGSHARADAPAWEVFLPKAGEVGSGEFRYWGFLVYDASLWAPLGEYRSDGPFALSLRYARSISRDDIVKASIDQMRDLGFAVERHPEWTQKLNQVMASVKAGDTLTGVYTPGQGAVFFYNDKLTGQIDERLAEAFFAIWLNPRTSEPALRQALLGQSGGAQ